MRFELMFKPGQSTPVNLDLLLSALDSLFISSFANPTMLAAGDSFPCLLSLLGSVWSFTNDSPQMDSEDQDEHEEISLLNTQYSMQPAPHILHFLAHESGDLRIFVP